MKKIVILTLALVGSLCAYAQDFQLSEDGLTGVYTIKQTAEPIYRAGNTYIMGNQTMDKFQYAGYLKNTCPAAYAKFHSGYTLSSIGWGCFAGGLALEVASNITRIVQLSYGTNPSQYYPWYATVDWLGHTLTTASIPLLIIGYCKQHNSVGIYNNAIGQPYVTLNATEGGIGIAYHF